MTWAIVTLIVNHASLFYINVGKDQLREREKMNHPRIRQQNYLPGVNFSVFISLAPR
jgi:hypothetical protein